MQSSSPSSAAGTPNARISLIETLKSEFPKGGGAIQGMGDVVSNTSFTGTAGLSIPLPVLSAGRLAPALHLIYSSAQGQGPFGLGFAMSLPVIARRTSRGAPRFDGSDTFSLDGEELVADEKGPGGGSSDVRITRYHRRLEGKFDYIEFHESKSDKSQSFWKVFAADGTLHMYGATHDACLADPADAAHIVQWWLQESVNARGEHVSYVYKREAPQPACAHVPYLKQVRFGNRRPDPESWILGGVDLEQESWMFALVLDYGEHGDDPIAGPVYAPLQSWSSRQDGFSRFEYGFEVRCERICRRALLFHHFETLGTQPVAVRELALAYAHSPSLTRLIELRIRGYRSQGMTLETAALPPLALEYSAFELSDAAFRPLPDQFMRADVLRYQIVDLYGEGIPGILYTDDESHLYRRAEGIDVTAEGLDVRYAQQACALRMPAGGLDAFSLMDLSGDGMLDAVSLQAGVHGFFTRDGEDGWQQFVPFDAFPAEFTHERAQFADLTGDGRPDLALIGPRSVRLYANRGRSGFAEGVDVPHEDGPPHTGVLPTPPGGGQTLCALADVLGSGQQHLVRVRHAEVTCWPNLGHGRFGAARNLPIRMHPTLTTDSFDPEQVLLADLDGSGAADLIYVGKDMLYVHLNRCGNGFDDAWVLPLPEGVRNSQLNHLSMADLYGNRTSALIMSSRDASPRHWVCDFTRGIKPHLLCGVNDNMGAQMRLHYTSSAHEWLEERVEDAGARCRLPFAVHLVQCIEHIDEVSGLTLTQRTRYRLGYYDPNEREVRGFGLVVRQDIEGPQADPSLAPGLLRTDASGKPFTEGAQVKTWYHNGAPDGDILVDAYTGGPRSSTLPSSRFESMSGELLAPSAQRHRALSGVILREEIYGLDDTSIPYHVSAVRYCVRERQAPGAVLSSTSSSTTSSAAGEPSVLQPYELERLSVNYERQSADALLRHDVNLAVDTYGTITRALNLAYPRQAAHVPGDADLRDTQQEAMHVHETLVHVHHLSDPHGGAGWRLGLVVETRAQALLGVSAPANGLYDWEILQAADGPLNGTATELASWQRILYTDARTLQPLPPGIASIHALLCQVRNAQLGRAELRAAFDRLQPAPEIDLDALEQELVSEGGYILEGDYFWNPGLTAEFHPQSGFFAVCAHVDAFGARTRYVYDPDALLVQAVTDALGNQFTAEHDYRALAPERRVDINGNVSEVRYDALARVHLTSFHGSELAFDSDVPQPAGFAPLRDYVSNITDLDGALQDPEAAIDKAACAFYYESDSWMGTLEYAQLEHPDIPESERASLWQRLVRDRLLTEEGFVQARLRALNTRAALSLFGPAVGAAVMQAVQSTRRTPAHSAAFMADRYFSDADASQRQVRVALVFSDGFGRVLQSKLRTEGGESYVIDDNGNLVVDAQGNPVLQQCAERWLTTGHVLYSSKGEPVRQYDPYYLNVPDHATDTALSRFASSDTLYYDALGRVREVQTADGYLRRTQYHPWHQIDWDENDTLGETPAAAATSNTAAAYAGRARLTTAAQIAEICRDTPEAVVRDGRGNGIREVQYYRSQVGEAPRTRVTRYVRDVLGRQISSSDARFFALQQSDPATPANERMHYSLGGWVLRHESRDAGWRVSVLTSDGELLRGFDARGQRWRFCYDVLRRPLARYLARDQSVEACREQWCYGEESANAEEARALNQRGRLVRHFDPAGCVVVRGYTLLGMNSAEQRRFLLDPESPTDWPADAALAESLLESQDYVSHWRYDALGALLEQVDAAGHRQRQAYYKSGRLESRHVCVLGDAEKPILQGRAYTPEGAVEREHLGNGVTVLFDYDARTRRLNRRRAVRDQDQRILQDLSYQYDPIGNLLEVEDAAQAVRYFRNQQVMARSSYSYDSLYQLISATGREHAGAGQEDSGLPAPLVPLPSNGSALVTYSRTFQYDEAGNLLETRHEGAIGYRSSLTLSPESNRAVASGIGINAGDVEGLFDAHGNPLSLSPGNAPLIWDADDRLQRVTQIARPDGNDDRECYAYGGNARRVRKWRVRWTGTVGQRAEVRYLPGLELRTDAGIGEQLELLVAPDGPTNLRVLHWRAGQPAGLDDNSCRYSLNDHLGSNCIELDETGQLVSREEYYPYGGTAVWAAQSDLEVKYKITRYSGRERDASGLYDYGFRYYAPWLGRWLNPDPGSTVDGLNLFRMARNNPATLWDNSGLSPVGDETKPLLVLHNRPKNEKKGYNDKMQKSFGLPDSNVVRITGEKEIPSAIERIAESKYNGLILHYGHSRLSEERDERMFGGWLQQTPGEFYGKVKEHMIKKGASFPAQIILANCYSGDKSTMKELSRLFPGDKQNAPTTVYGSRFGVTTKSIYDISLIGMTLGSKSWDDFDYSSDDDEGGAAAQRNVWSAYAEGKLLTTKSRESFKRLPPANSGKTPAAKGTTRPANRPAAPGATTATAATAATTTTAGRPGPPPRPRWH